MAKSKRLRRLIKQAKMGKPHTMYALGLCYQLGKEVPQDMQKAAEWIFAAADEGYIPAIEWAKDYSFADNAYECGE